MCGFSGFFLKNGIENSNPSDILLKMNAEIEHRGPNDSGIWYDRKSLVGLSHRRLSIQDLSKRGHQPMTSNSGRYVIAYNGEIYNHKSLRKKIENCTIDKIKWHGTSDTETLLACIESFGVKRALKEVSGMFAFALWDCKYKSLVLARDRFGEKPLYYGLQNGALLFGSDLKSMKQHPKFQGEINRGAIALLMRYGYIPCPSSIYTNIYKLPPGSYITFQSPESLANIVYYWKLSNNVNDNIIGEHPLSYKDSVQKLNALIGDSVEMQMASDVPVGSLLSGGIDSTLITALAQSRSIGQIKTFTIGFDENLYNEARHAKEVAKYLDTNHTELYVTPKDAIDVIQKIPDIYTEPFADPSQIPTFLVSEMVKKHVTVSLSGDAGDEIFAGYNRYVMTDQYWKKISNMPHSLKQFISRNIENIPPDRLNKFLLHMQKMLPTKYQQVNIGEKLHKASIALRSKTPDELYCAMISRWQNPEDLVINVSRDQTLVKHPIHFNDDDIVHKMMEIDTVTYLPDDILCKVDRSSMFVGLEARSPFLDHKIVEFAWSLPLEYKIKNGMGKAILRDVLYKHVPKELVNRPKMGFGVPISSWLRGPLKEWANDLLSEDLLRSEGFFYAELVRKKWHEHQLGTHNWQYQLWTILMFQLWLKNEKKS